ncbi:group-specific protein [Peribacillus sp. SCS-37]|uniref:group-specific protein n=1 Tax=Paraperibacillus esterisolvens TaxID=3115296 RepID=UPI003906594A
MKFYIASSFKNIGLVRKLAGELRAENHIHTYDWTKNSRAASFSELKRIGEEEKQAVWESDVFILILPGGKGSHIELGMAIGQGKQIWLYSPPDDASFSPENSSTFYHLSEVQRFRGSFADFIQHIKNESA